MSNYHPVPFPFDDPSNPDVAIETPLWKGGPRPQWEVSGEKRPSAGDISLNGKTYNFPVVDLTNTITQDILDRTKKAIDDLMVPRIGGYVDPISKMNVNDVRHPISPSCLCPTPVTCSTNNWCHLSDKKSLGVDTSDKFIPVLWNGALMDAVKTNQLLRGEWLPVKSSPKQRVYSRLSSIFYSAGSWLRSISDWFDERS